MFLIKCFIELSSRVNIVGGRCAYCYLNVPNLYVNLHAAFFFPRDRSWLILVRYSGNHLFRRTISPPNKLPYLIRAACCLALTTQAHTNIALGICLPAYIENIQEKNIGTIKMTIRDSPSSRNGKKPADASASLQHPVYRPFETLEPVRIRSFVSPAPY